MQPIYIIVSIILMLVVVAVLIMMVTGVPGSVESAIQSFMRGLGV